jgi:hypothetical protein
MISLSPLFGTSMYTGGLRGPAKVEEPGWKQERMLIVKIPAPSFGVGTRVRQMLSLMSFEEVSTLLTYSAGLTVILCEWKSKGVVVPLLESIFG